LYRSRAVIIPLGDDFRYGTLDEAETQFSNFQKIFDYLNANAPGVHARFGTLSDYFEAVQTSFTTPIPVLKGSFFTYSDRDEDYWSGYFTSRVFDKALGRRLERSLFAAAMMGATKEEMRGPRRSLSLFQHHDGVTGTAKAHVVQDYAHKLHTSIMEVQHWMAAKVGIGKKLSPLNPIEPCHQNLFSPRSMYTFECDTSKPLYVFNPLTHEQYCGKTVIPALSTVEITQYPCESPGLPMKGNSLIQFGSNGMMTYPIQEEWNVWMVDQGGAYLFFPRETVPFSLDDAVVELNGYSVKTPNWSRTVIEKQFPGFHGRNVTILDFEYETNLVFGNQEWFVRMKAPIDNKGIFHTV
jgi:alpha-mannosidase II